LLVKIDSGVAVEDVVYGRSNFVTLLDALREIVYEAHQEVSQLEVSHGFEMFSTSKLSQVIQIKVLVVIHSFSVLSFLAIISFVNTNLVDLFHLHHKSFFNNVLHEILNVVMRRK